MLQYYRRRRLDNLCFLFDLLFLKMLMLLTSSYLHSMMHNLYLLLLFFFNLLDLLNRLFFDFVYNLLLLLCDLSDFRLSFLLFFETSLHDHLKDLIFLLLFLLYCFLFLH